MADLQDLTCVDPVCGHKVSSKSSIKFSYQGDIYYFCSKKCYGLFKKNPEKYSLNAKKSTNLNKKVTSNLDNSVLFNKEVTLKVSGITSISCIEKIEADLAKEMGVVSINSDIEHKKITIAYNPDLVSEKNLLEIINNSGYRAEYIKTRNIVFVIDGLNNTSFSNRLESVLNKQFGVVKATVNFITEEAAITYLPDETDIERLINVIESSGYKALNINNLKDLSILKQQKNEKLKSLKKNVFLSFLLSMLIFLFNSNSNFLSLPDFFRNPFLSFLLATPVQFWAGLHFYREAFKSLKYFDPDNNFLIVLATTVVYLYSSVETFFPSSFTANKTYFEVSSVLITLFLLGSYFTSLMKNNISDTADRLTMIQPETVKVKRGDKTEEILIENVQVEDIVFVEPGEKIPVDGVIIEGSSFVDESIFSGDNTPILKNKNELVISGSINKSNILNFQATKIGNESFLSKYVSLLEAAYSSKTLLQEKNDKVINIFSKVILLFSILTFIFWVLFAREQGIGVAILNAVSVIAVSTPCILALSIPFAAITGISKATELGWLYKNAQSIAVSSKVTTLIMDKTGILTKAEPIITDIMTFNGYDGNTVLKIAASIENHSEHILGNAIVQEAKNKNFDLWLPTDFHYILGMGIEANVNGYQTLIGNKQLMKLKSIDIDTLERMSKKLSGEGKTTVFIAISGIAAGIIAISDVIKEESKPAIEKLKKLGLDLILLTGDNHKTAISIAEQIGIESKNVISEASPTKKIKIINSLQKEKKVVAVVCENTNDAPYQNMADIIFSFGQSINSPENNYINFLNADLDSLSYAIQFSKRVIKTIKQNLFWSYVYYLIGIPLSTGLLVPLLSVQPEPIIVGLGTLISFVLILINSLELKKIKIS